MRILEGGRERILTTGEGRGEDHPDTMYRLSEEWASKLGLVSAWSRLTSSGVSSETAFGRRAIKRLKEAGMGEGGEEEESVVTFSQDWEWSRPVV